METIEEWWNSCHSSKTDHLSPVSKLSCSYFVSDFGGPDLWNSLNIADRIYPNALVLEIGVGGGRDIRELHARGVKVHVLDITPAALDKVRAFTEGQWLEPQIELLPENRFDIAISHLVTQHISNEALSRQIKYVLRALKTNGVFAMQFADRIKGVDRTSYEETLDAQKEGGVCRSLEMIDELVNTSGGKITWVSLPQDFPTGARWYNIHIRNKSFTRLSKWGDICRRLLMR
ncbi:MAG TPA: class I SAM-dependent methyltransferase [Syntrophorhabdales bacterium]|nr:class I SAM-dependent methyltransferase [Syntrophorhabdales bacterium]